MSQIQESMSFQSSFTLNGWSMHPMLLHNQEIEVELFYSPKRLQDMAIGEVVLVRDGREWVIHRVIEKNGQKFTKGDASLCLDSQHPVWGYAPRKKDRFASWLSKHLNNATPRPVRWLVRTTFRIYSVIGCRR